MSFESSTQHFDVVGSGYIAEHHAHESIAILLRQRRTQSAAPSPG